MASACVCTDEVEEKMKLVKNKSSGTKHLPGDEKTTKCGASLIQNGKENATWEDDEWLDDFPEDFGDGLNDCDKCAKMMEEGQ